MYKLLLSWRYLRTRYIALASIISVTLGVATLIVVNSVMAGFTSEMYKRLHGILSDIVFESHNLDGMPDPEWHIAEIRKVCGDDLAGLTAVVHVPAMLNFQVNGQWVTRQVNLIGIDDTTYAQVSDFSQYLLHPDNRKQIGFRLREDGFDERLPSAGWKHRRLRAAYEKARREQDEHVAATRTTTPPPGAADPFAKVHRPVESTFDPAREQHTGVILGIAICSVRHREDEGNVKDYFLCRPGDDVQITFPNAGQPPKAVSDHFTVVDLYESKMSEYDSSFAFVPLRRLQDLRGMIDNLRGTTAVTSIQLKLRDGVDLNSVRDKLRARFPTDQYAYRIETWRELQGPLLAAVQLETTILNILLFLIIAVAGFGILATFFMIVVEKTRDIGVLKALGAPSGGVMSIFLGYGLSLGAVGSGAGAVLGLLFVTYINQIADFLGWLTGREVFDPTVYYFDRIPTINDPATIVGVACGAMTIAVVASILPALRAARLHPVEALRYE